MYPATRCFGSVWLNGKERKEKAYFSNMFNFTLLVGIQCFCCFIVCEDIGLPTLQHATCEKQSVSRSNSNYCAMSFIYGDCIGSSSTCEVERFPVLPPVARLLQTKGLERCVLELFFQPYFLLLVYFWSFYLFFDGGLDRLIACCLNGIIDLTTKILSLEPCLEIVRLRIVREFADFLTYLLYVA